jgi:glycosyltransferase involved in cell wall biosynthesis
MVPLHNARVLVLHPFLNFYGGSEYLLSVVVNEIVPQADIFTFSYRDSVIAETKIDRKRIISPFGDGLLARMYRQLTPLYPSLMDTQAFDGYDVVLSFSYAYVHGLVTSHRVPHVSYIHSPLRLLWMGFSDYYRYGKIPIVRNIYNSILSWQRIWDQQAATRPDYLLASSKEVQNRIRAFWSREAEVLHPPVDTDLYAKDMPSTKEDYFVTSARLVEYKRIDLLIQACLAARKKLVVIGDGPMYKKLKRIAAGSPDITFTGYLSPEDNRKVVQKAKGYLYAAEEDFGISLVESLAAGTPVLTYGKGGAIETVTPDCGILVKEQSVESFSQALDEFERFAVQVSPKILQRQAAKFSRQNFVAQYTSTIARNRQEFEEKGAPVLG